MLMLIINIVIIGWKDGVETAEHGGAAGSRAGS
jgi:hypothetical protein